MCFVSKVSNQPFYVPYQCDCTPLFSEATIIPAACVLCHQVAPVIKARMMEYGTTMVSYQPQGDKVNFFRMVISNPAATFEDIDFLIEEIERLGQDL